MPKAILIAAKARRRLYQIQDYHVEQGYPKKGRKLVQTPGKQIAKLGKQPELGPIVEALSSELVTFRSFVAEENYRVFYVVKQDQVVVLEIFDVRQDPSRLTFD